jgi:cytochrome c oxidase subunit 3
MEKNDQSQNNNRSSKINVYSSLVYVGIISSIMLFAGLSSAVLVRKMDKFWVNVHLPNYFLVSTIIIVISSITLFLASKAAKKGRMKLLKSFLLSSLLLGFCFCIFQYFGWKKYYNNGNAVKSFITYVYGQYGQSFYIVKKGEKIIYNGANYEINGTQLSASDVNEIKLFSYQFCRDDHGYRSKKIEVASYGNPYAIYTSDDNSIIQMIDGYPHKNGVKFSESDGAELFKFAFGVYHNKPFFMLEGDYGRDFSVSLNGENLDYNKKKLYFPARTLNNQQKKKINELVYQAGKEYEIKDGAVYFEGSIIDMSDFETYLLLKNGIEIEIENGNWTQLKQELNSTQYGEFFQTTNVSSSFVWVLTGIHFLHICLGLLILLVIFFRALKNKYNEKNQAGLKAGSIFWHFVGLLWVYLYVFLEYIN